MPILRLPILRSENPFANTVGIGASEVAAVCHLDPWRSAYELWQVKTGRREKDPQTDAMLFGISMEERGMLCYERLNGLAPMERQVAAVHHDLPFLRGFVDGWNGSRGVDVKTPSGVQLLDDVWEFGEEDEFVEGIIPPHYLCQCAAYMEMFGVREWDFFVYWAADDWGVTLKARWDDMWDPDRTLGQFWEGTAVPLLREFWRRMDEDIWVDSPDWPMPDSAEWLAAIEQRSEAMKGIKELEKVKSEATARLKQMLGFQSRTVHAGWEAGWQYRHGQAQVVVKCEDAATVERILPSLLPLAEADGVESVEDGSRADSQAFIVKSLTPVKRMKK